MLLDRERDDIDFKTSRLSLQVKLAEVNYGRGLIIATIKSRRK